MTVPCQQCGALMDGAPSWTRFCGECLYQRARADGKPQAHRKVAAAVASGKLPKARTLKCVDCGKQALDYDHRDYSKPLDVVPVCRSCNKRRGPGLPALTQPTDSSLVSGNEGSGGLFHAADSLAGH